jgi:hypothetical protein
MFTDYPLILMEHYQPLVLPALAGLIFYVIDRLRRRHEPVVEEDSGVIARAARVEGPHRMRSTEADLMVVWAVLPVVLYSLSSLRHLRYLFPLLPVYALLTGYLLSAHAKRLVLPLCCWVVPIVTIASTFVFWFAPSLLAGDNNQVFKQNMDVARERLEPGTVLPYNGEEYWPEANPFLYYWDVKLERPGDTTEEAVAKALAAPHRSMVCVREKLEEVDGMNLGHEAVVEGKGWAWLEFPERGEPERSEED